MTLAICTCTDAGSTWVTPASGAAIIPVAVETVIRFEAWGDYVTAYTGKSRHMLHLSLNRLSRMRPRTFVMRVIVGPQTIVNKIVLYGKIDPDIAFKKLRAMAQLFPIDQIFDNPAYPGILAGAFIDAGIPAFTPEIGASRILDRSMILLFFGSAEQEDGQIGIIRHQSLDQLRVR